MRLLRKTISIILIVAFIVTAVPYMSFNKGKGVFAATQWEVVRDAASWAAVTPYVYGGTDLEKGCDCSGFVCAIYKRHGLDLIKSYNVRSTTDMLSNISKYGVYVGNTLKDVQPGYIIITNGGGHAGIGAIDAYGNKMMIHAPNTGQKVRIDSLSYYTKYSSGITAVIKPNVLNGVLYRNVVGPGTVTLPADKNSQDAPVDPTTEPTVSEEAKNNPGYPYPLQTEKITTKSSKDAVKWLQQALNMVNNAGLSVDGSYGPLTKKAVKDFQKRIGQKANGKASKAMVIKLTEIHIMNMSVTSVIVDHEDIDVLEEGQRLSLSANVTPAESEGVTIIWSSSDEKLATITDKGVVRALKSGDVVITATAPNGVSVQKKLYIEKSWHKSEWYNGWYYNSKGKQKRKLSAQWKTADNGKKMFTDSSGWKAKKKWLRIDGHYYYFDKEGYALTNGWHRVKKYWYYFTADGARLEKQWINGKYLSEEGKWEYRYLGFWENTDDGWMYKDTSGWYAKGGSIRIDGVKYTFNKKGICTDK